MIMTAGGVSTIHESFNIPYALSSVLLISIILITLFLKFERLIAILGMVTPFLVIIVTIIAMYYLMTGSLSFMIPINTRIPGLFDNGGSMQLTMGAYKLQQRSAFICNGRSFKI